ncbi:hypothetical protein NBRC116494_30920 [Aurantivibrio plasticivorans]
MNQFAQYNVLRGLKLIALVSLSVGVLSGFTSCSSDSGGDNTQVLNPNGNNNGGSGGISYDGPAAASSDVTEFKVNLWDNIVADNRCGNCHKQDGPGTTWFVRDDNINTAYQAALTVVDLENPGDSLLVQRMASDHNCWDVPNVCADLMETWISNWANATEATTTVVTIDPVPAVLPGASLNFPPPVPAAFESNVYTPILREYCSRCHSEDGSERQQQPYFASGDVTTAYRAAQSKIDLNDASNSRLVYRLAVAPHTNCWDPNDAGGPVDCAANAVEMEAGIQAFIDSLGSPATVDPDELQVSGALAFPANPSQGQSANAAGRYESNIIAKYEFKQLDNTNPDRVVDTSGISPQLDLTRTGDARFVSSWGMEFFGPSGRAQGLTSNSRKLRDAISLTGEFAVEAWVIPANVTQDNVRRIISYSGGPSERNFTLGQTLYNYNTLLRTDSVDSNGNGSPLYSTPDGDDVLQASLQHVVVNFDATNGRQIWVNGELTTTDADVLANSSPSNWSDSHVLVLGNEVGGMDLDWKGTLRFVAIHNRVLTQEQILTNFSVGVGQKYYMPFNISSLVNIPEAYIVFEVERFDDYSYLFNDPFFTVLEEGVVISSDIDIQGMRIGINGREAPTGQAFAKMDVTITDADYQAAENNWLRLSTYGIPVTGTIIASEKVAPETDEFFLSFDRIGVRTSSVDRSTPDYPDVALPVYSYKQSEIGLKHFYEINEMFSSLTGVSKDNALVAGKFDTLKTQLPSSEDPVAFSTTQQMGITQLAAAYCEALTASTSLRTAFWPSLNFGQALNTQRNAVLDPMLEKFSSQTFMDTTTLATQPDPTDMAATVDTLLAELSTAANASETDSAALAVCTSVFASAVANVQ